MFFTDEGLAPQDNGSGCGAVEGNMLEAVNIAANSFSLHFNNRRLDRTGLQITVFTAGQVSFQILLEQRNPS